jgi:NADPH:quinone reductase-like Zn-dependent oxidoreductase
MSAGVVPDGSKFADAVRRHGEPSVVLELVGGPYIDEDIRTVPMLGRIVLVGLLAGVRTEVDLAGILRKRIRVFGTMLRARPLEEKIAVMRSFEAQVVPLFQRGLIAPVIDTVMDLDAAAAAHERMASNVGFGKIVLRT